MAITKIWNIGATKEGSSSTYLLNSLRYITNGEKTRENILVGSRNCMPIVDLAYEQMKDTKKIFSKQTGRQGYHMVIAFEKGETDPDTAFDIAGKFVDRFLADEYECVYAVHDDKDHIHAHIVFNSVNLSTGRKFSYKKGDWKNIIQPITNELCSEYGLSIMPAEYALEKSNLSRKEYNNLSQYKEFIRADIEYVLCSAKSIAHFEWLLRQIGYDVKDGAHIAVKLPGMKRYARIDTIDKRFSKENIIYEFGQPMSMRAYPNIIRDFRPRSYDTKLKFPAKYQRQLKGMQVCMVYRYKYRPAWLYHALKDFKRLQEEYNFIRKYEIKDEPSLIALNGVIEAQIQKISDEQKNLYRENAAYKRRCHTPDELMEYQKFHLMNSLKLSELKEEKKNWCNERRLFHRCYERRLLDVFDKIGYEWRDTVIDIAEGVIYDEPPQYEDVQDKTVPEAQVKEDTDTVVMSFIDEYFSSLKGDDQYVDEGADREFQDNVYGGDDKDSYDFGWEVRGAADSEWETENEDRGSEADKFRTILAEGEATRAASERYRRDSESRRRDSEIKREDRETEWQRSSITESRGEGKREREERSRTR